MFSLNLRLFRAVKKYERLPSKGIGITTIEQIFDEMIKKIDKIYFQRNRYDDQKINSLVSENTENIYISPYLN